MTRPLAGPDSLTGRYCYKLGHGTAPAVSGYYLAGEMIPLCESCASEREATPVLRECDARTLVAQIGKWNLAAISGGRVTVRQTGVSLPVSSGYRVDVDLLADDTYRVRRVFRRAGKEWVKGERTGIYCDQVGEQAYLASCFRNVDFG